MDQTLVSLFFHPAKMAAKNILPRPHALHFAAAAAAGLGCGTPHASPS